jgi:hypothetical protein
MAIRGLVIVARKPHKAVNVAVVRLLVIDPRKEFRRLDLLRFVRDKRWPKPD